MKITEKNFNNLEEDILEAQKKLLEINNAIDRDRKIREDKQNDIDNLLEQEKSIILSLKELELLKKQDEVVYDTTRKSYEAEIDKLNKEKLIISNNIDNLIQLQLVEQSKLDKIKQDIDREIKTLKDYQIKEESDLKSKNIKIKEDNDILNEKLVFLKAKIDKLENTEKKLMEDIEFKEKENQVQLKITSEILQNTIKRDELISDIDKLESHLLESKDKHELLISRNKEIENETNKKQFELEEIKRELNDYTQKRMSLVNEAKRLEQKEIYIKNKFTEAGLSYN